VSVEPTADSATDDNTTACSNVAQPAEAKATDARKRFQFDTLVAPADASKVVSPKCSGHIALRRTDEFLCEKLRLVRHRMRISRRQHQVLKSVSSPRAEYAAGQGLKVASSNRIFPNDAASGTSEGMGVMVPPILWDEDCQHRACPVYPWSQVPDPRPY